MKLPEPSAVLDVRREDGAVLRLRRHGNPRGKRLFFSHGNGFAIDGYFGFWRHFLAGFEVLVFDMRNHGCNPLSAERDHDYAHMARDMGAMWRAADAEFGAKPTAGIFHSMSAQSAMLAALAGESFDALVLFDPPNVPPDDDPAREKMLTYLRMLTDWAAQRRDHFAAAAELAAEYAATRAGRAWTLGTPERVAEAVLRPSPAGDWTLACPPRYESSMYAQGIPLALWPRRADFPMPVKLIGGDPERDYPSPTGLSNRALARDGGFDYTAVPGTSHLLQLEEPAACAAATLTFLTGIGFTGSG